MEDGMGTASVSFSERQHRLASKWEKFGDIVHDYLGIPYKGGGRAVKSVTREPTGVATREAGLVCTSFVDVVLSRYIYDDAEEQLDSYKFGKGVNIFDRYGLRKLGTNIEPANLGGLGLQDDQVYGVVFHMKKAWTKKTRRGDVSKDPGSRIHVGFLAFNNGNLFLIHASGAKGVHIIAWQRFLTRFGPQLQRFGGAQIRGPKFLSVYLMQTTGGLIRPEELYTE
jgi:hypothetical protein